MKNRVEVMHGVNLDVLERRDADIYGGGSLTELEVRVKRFADEMGLEATFSQTNHEGEFCELLHRAPEIADGLLLNPGAWTHYSYAIRDAIELTRLPAVEVHLSAIDHREDWRHAVVRELKEETGIDAAARDVRLVDAMSAPDGHLLLFGLLPERPVEGLPPSRGTDETEGWHLLRRPEELAFPLHSVAVRAWFEGRY